MSESIILSEEQYQDNIKRTMKYHNALLNDDGKQHLEYLMDQRKLSMDTIKKFYLGAVLEPEAIDRPAQGRISIPIINVRGPMAIRFRALGASDMKYWSPAGTKTSVYNVAELKSALDTVAISEGEFECMVLTQCGIHAVGISGSQAWKGHYRYLFEGLQKVYVAGDGDDAGQLFAAKVAEQVPNPQVVALPQGKDINDVYIEGGVSAVRDLFGLSEKEESNE